MNAIIITIGDEILIGQTIDTNSAFIGKELSAIGISVKEIISISDDEDHILQTLERVQNTAPLVMITGGLGPTKDDITKHTLCKYFKSKLVFNQQTHSLIKSFFEKRGKELTERNEQQAYLPANAIPLSNAAGTAPGMWFERGETIFISMPGVPYEMQQILKESVIPKIKSNFTLPEIIHTYILTIGIRESFLADKLIDFEEQLPNHIKLAYLPGIGKVKLRLSGKGSNKQQLIKEINTEVEKVQQLIPQYIYGYDEDSIEKIIGELLINKTKTVGTGESCTAGLIANKLTTIPGSSAYFKGGIVAYSNTIKENLLNVSTNIINKYGAVSKEVVEEMAKGVLSKLDTAYAITISGIAGPDGGTEEKPVGTVWIAVGDQQNIISKLYSLNTGNRIRNMELSANTALNMFRKLLLGELE